MKFLLGPMEKKSVILVRHTNEQRTAPVKISLRRTVGPCRDWRQLESFHKNILTTAFFRVLAMVARDGRRRGGVCATADFQARAFSLPTKLNLELAMPVLSLVESLACASAKVYELQYSRQ